MKTEVSHMGKAASVMLKAADVVYNLTPVFAAWLYDYDKFVLTPIQSDTDCTLQ